MKTVAVAVKRLPHGAGLPLPEYATAASAGMDLMAAVDDPVELAPGARLAVPVGIAMALPEGFEAQVRPRSGLALTHGLTVLNSPGTIDADYRGEIKVILANLSCENFRIERGMRIAQLVIAPVVVAAWVPTDALPETDRAAGGFGSTGATTRR